MLDYNAIKEVIRAAVVTTSGALDASVKWGSHSDASIYQVYPQIELKVRKIKAYGDDATLYTTTGSGPTEAMVITIAGPRELRVEVRVISDNQDSQEAAGTLGERIRTRLQRRSILDVFKSAGIGLGLIADAIEQNYPTPEGRELSVCVIEILFNVLQLDVDTDSESGFIEHVTFESNKLKHPDGSDSLNQFSFTVDKP